MAQNKCPECGREVSDKADKCVNCGYPLVKIEQNCKKNYVIMSCCLIVIIVAAIAFSYFSKRFGFLHAKYFFDVNRDSITFGVGCGKYISMAIIIVSIVVFLLNLIHVLIIKGVIRNIQNSKR